MHVCGVLIQCEMAHCLAKVGDAIGTHGVLVGCLWGAHSA